MRAGVAMERRERAGAVATLLLGVAVGFATGVAAQADVDNSISLRTYNCPDGMTADALVGDDCAPVTEGFEVRIDSLSGVMAPLTLADATLEGDAFVWGNDVVDDRGAFGPLAIRETVLPRGYTEYLVLGDDVAQNRLGDWTFAVTPQHPDPVLRIYNLAPTEPREGETLTPPSPGGSASPEADPVRRQPGGSAAIGAGTCDELEAESDTPLAPLVETTGPRIGSGEAAPVAVSYSSIDVPMEVLLASDHAVVVYRSERSSREDEAALVACGEIGGTRLPGGALAIGLRERNGSGLVGIAYLAPLPDGRDQTQVSLFVARRLAEGE